MGHGDSLPAAVLALLTAHPPLRAVLADAAPPLARCFGPHLTTLEVLEDGEGGAVLRLRVHLPAGTDPREAEAALARAFDVTPNDILGWEEAARGHCAHA